MNIHDLTPEEREVYRQAFVCSLMDARGYRLVATKVEVHERASYQATSAVYDWREHLTEQMKAAVKESDNELG